MSSSPPQGGSGSGADRRRYTRLPIKLDALVAVDGRPPVQCTVRDFCVAGVFVALPPQQLRLVKTQTAAILYFALVVDGEQKDYQIGLRIFRVIGGGFGCGFENADPDTVNLLQALATSMNPQSVPETPEAVSQRQSGFSWRFAEVQQPLAEMVTESMETACQDFNRLVDEALFVAARDAGNNVDESRFLDAQNEMRSRRDDISKGVPELVGKGVAIMNSALRQSDEPDEGLGATELTLIDKDEFEEFLTVSHLVSELEPRFKDPLYQLDRRFSVLANHDIDELTNPIGPAIVCGAFSEQLKHMETDRAAINVIYRTLRKVLEPNLEKLYADVNEMLVEFGVLPVIEKESAKSKAKRPPAAKSGAPSAEEPPPPIEEDMAPPDAYGTTFPDAGAQQYPGMAGQPNVQAATPSQFAAGQIPAGSTAGFPGIDPGTQAHPGAGVPQGQLAPSAGGQTAMPNVQVAAPAMPAGFSQAGTVVQPGALPPGAVQAGMVQPGAVQAGAVQAGVPGMVAPGGAVQGGAMPSGMGYAAATFGGFGAGPAVHVPPSMQQAYSAAQAQMALRRNLAPAPAGDGGMQDAAGSAYAPRQIVDGLTQIQQSLANTQHPQMLGVNSMKERIRDAIVGAGGSSGAIGQRESDAIEVIANLFEVLVEDALLTDSAKSQLARLQAPVHKTALMDQEFFEATSHPVRQLLNRVSMLRDGTGEDGNRLNARVSDLIGQLNSDFKQDLSVIEPVLGELDQILREQRDAYDANVAGVVSASEEQQKILSERRGKSLESTDSGLIQNEQSEEWSRWLERSKLLEVGERLVMNANTKNPSLVTLVWVGEKFNPFVFVDDQGDKSSSLTLEQVAMYLRRGTLKQLLNEDGGAVDRALFGVVNRMHGEVEAQATHDELTEFMNRKTFLQTVERLLPENRVGSTGPVICQISLDNLKTVNDDQGVAAGDAMLNMVAEAIKETIQGKSVTLGRLGGGELGVFWKKGGVQSAYKKLRACFEKTGKSEAEFEGEPLKPVLYAGITAIEDGMTTPEQLVSVVSEACATAKSSNDKPIHVVGSENKYREQLEQMVSYIGKAHDRERLVLLHQAVKSLSEDDQLPAMHIVVTAEDRNGKLVPPDFFSQALHNSERAFEIDQWTLKNTFSWMAENGDELDNFAAVILPLSHAAVRNDEISSFIINQLMETAVPPGKIFFEVADKDAISNVTEVAELVRTLKEFGCRFILDEFGSGQGNYDYVKELAVDFVTIQSAYITDAMDNPKDFAMAKSINELVHFMGKKTIGKQDPGTDVVDVLREIGVDFVYDQSKTNRIAA